jgi:hypothetical protein
MQRQRHVFKTAQRRQQVEKLKNKADLVPPQLRQRIVAQPAQHRPVQRNLPVDGLSNPPIRLSRVDLPDPDGPTSETISPLVNPQIDHVQRGDLLFAVKPLGYPSELYHSRLLVYDDTRYRRGS